MKIKTIVVQQHTKTFAYHKQQISNAIASMRIAKVSEKDIQLAT